MVKDKFESGRKSYICRQIYTERERERGPVKIRDTERSMRNEVEGGRWKDKMR